MVWDMNLKRLSGLSSSLRWVPLLILVFLWVPGLCAAVRPLKLDMAKSRVEVAVKVTVDSFVASLEKYDAQITLDEAAAAPASAQFGFQFSDLKTGKDKRDLKMLSWLQSEKHPSGLFELQGMSPRAEGGWLAKGKLSFHGLTKEVEFPVTLVTEAGRVVLEGTASVDTQAYGLPIIRMLAVLKVDPVVVVKFHLEGSHD